MGRYIAQCSTPSADGNLYASYPSGMAPVWKVAPGNWKISQPMRLVYPRPDSETLSTAFHRWAYYDGVNFFPTEFRLGISFGAFPALPTILWGPPEMKILRRMYNGVDDTTWCDISITPSKPYVAAPWCVQYTDQSGALQNVYGTISTTSSPSQIVFLDADDGVDSSTRNGSINQPWQTALYAAGTATQKGAAPAGSTCYLMGANSKYWFPVTNSNNPNSFEANATTGPASYVQLPGSGVATVDLTGNTGTNPAAQLNPGSGDLFFRGFTMNGYNSLLTQLRGFYFADHDRMTFQNVIWQNSGFGVSSDNNASMIYTTGGNRIQGEYLFLSGLQDNNRQSSGQINNTSVCELYNYREVLVELCQANSPSTAFGACFFLKSDVTNCNLRASYGINLTGAQHGFDFGQAPYMLQDGNEVSYCYAVNTSKMWFTLGVSPTNMCGNQAVFRNSLILQGLGLVAGQMANSNLVSPYVSNALAPFGYSIPAWTTPISGGTLPADEYYCCVTCGGVSGESDPGDNGQGGSGLNVTTTGNGSVNQIVGNWAPEPYNSGYYFYRAPVIQPPTSVSVALAAGGSLTVATEYFWVITVKGAYGETIASMEVSATPTSGNQSAALSWTNPSGAVSVSVYRGTASGKENVRYSLGLVTSFTDNGSGGTANTSPPTINSAVGAGGFVRFSVPVNATTFTDTGVGGTAGVFPPASGTGNAVSTARFTAGFNAVQTPTQTATPGGPTINLLGGDIFAVSGMLDPVTGKFTPAFNEANPGALGNCGAEVLYTNGQSV